MSSVNFKTARLFSKIFLFSIVCSVANAWDVDFSRRQVNFSRVQDADRLPASIQESQSMDILGSALDVIEPAQDIVIMNTDRGFVPEQIHLKKGGNYRIHIVNINNREKNVSFIADAFSEHHNTVYGEQKTFSVSPKTDGVFSYQCPETAIQGKFIIYSDAQAGQRKPASK